MKIRHDLLDTIHNYGVDIKNRVIYIHSEIGSEESGVDFRMASSFVKNIDYLESINLEPITLKILSVGGCWNYGMAIFDRIAASKAYITCQSFANATSMSSIIPQAADERHIHKHCCFMAHYGSYSDSGDFRQVASGIKFYEHTNEAMLEIYANKVLKSPFAKESKFDYAKSLNFVRDRIERLTDWWMSSEEAVYYGFMDKVI